MVRFSFRSASVALFLLCGVLFSALAVAARAELATRALTVEMASGKTHAFTVEVARTAQERERGLMERDTLDPDAGMLFDFGAPRLVTMWMHDTPKPLDMLFADKTGRITRIAAMTTPFSEDLISSGGDVLYVVEIRGGRAKELGIKVGDRLGGAALQHP
ncbi:DUF192 domain-containing protein [Rhizobium halophytocola]|uniref:Uncharacterized membrane protein (UPF0127 family) n=1 Tax=Rhizobium halophytocola TaxID=735519 RepID=A0ABS4DW60_9HYPH|nr:DUF192 domain-containing protein [Rhizobium halophytocola]MBP1849913.1 uncharacterized membrane protein (UPF0127 family) [Rhizobium halophytocola]